MSRRVNYSEDYEYDEDDTEYVKRQKTRFHLPKEKNQDKKRWDKEDYYSRGNEDYDDR